MRPMIVNRLRNGDLSAPPDQVLIIAGYDYQLPRWLCRIIGTTKSGCTQEDT